MICHRRSSDIFIWKYTFNLQNLNNKKPGSRTFHIIFGPFRGLKRTFSAVYTSVCSISNKLNVIFCVREKIFKLPNRASTFTRIPETETIFFLPKIHTPRTCNNDQIGSCQYRRVEQALAKTTLFFWLSINYGF